MENVATYSEARSEYTKQLATFIVPAIVQWFQQVWQRNSANRQQCLSLFQTECEEVGRWNQDRIHDEVRVLIERTGCDYMEELMTAVFVAHTKVLTAVRLSAKQKKLSITVPKLDHFIHRVFREAARAFWKTPFLFMAEGTVVERQKNVLQIEALATEAIATAVRSLLPVKQILKDYLEDDTEEIEEAPMPQMLEEKEPEMEEAEAAVEEKEEPKMEEKVEVAAEEKKEETPTISAPAIAAATETEAPAVPPVVKIDTESAVTFSDYDAVFDETKGAPEMRYTPKDEMGEDDEDEDDMPSDEPIRIVGDAVAIDDAEDLERPAALPARAPDRLDDDDMEVLE